MEMRFREMELKYLFQRLLILIIQDLIMAGCLVHVKKYIKNPTNPIESDNVSFEKGKILWIFVDIF